MQTSRYNELVEEIKFLSEKSELNKGQLKKLEAAKKKAAYAKNKIKLDQEKKIQDLQRAEMAKRGCLKIRDHEAFRAQLSILTQYAKNSEYGETMNIKAEVISDLLNSGVLCQWMIDSLYQMGIVIKATSTRVTILKSRLLGFNRAFH